MGQNVKEMRAVVVGAEDSRSRRVARDLNESGLQTRFTQITDVTDADLVVGCFRGDQNPELSVARAAVDAGSIYLSASESPETVQALLDLARERPESTLLVGCGWRPGLSGVLARFAAEEFSEDLEVAISWVRPPAPSERALQTMFPLTEDPRTDEVYFPEPLGWQKVRSSIGAETLTVPVSMPLAKKVTVRGASTGGSGLIERLGFPVGSSIDSWAALRVDVRTHGSSDGDVVSLAVMDQLFNLETSPLVAAAVMVFRGELRGIGARSLDAAVQPDRFIEMVSERGLRVARLDRHDF